MMNKQAERQLPAPKRISITALFGTQNTRSYGLKAEVNRLWSWLVSATMKRQKVGDCCPGHLLAYCSDSILGYDRSWHKAAP